MTAEDEAELRLLRLEKADRLNPNVLLLEGELTSGDEFYAVAVRTPVGEVYLAEAIEKIAGWQGKILTFAWHIASEPLSFHELEDHMIKTAMRHTEARFTHAYSDLTGYLWTNEDITCGGHDILREIQETAMSMGYPRYIALRVEKAE